MFTGKCNLPEGSNLTAAIPRHVNTRKFITPKLPVGKPITVVVISKQGNDYYLGHESAVTALTTAGQANQLVHVVPVKKSLSQILAYLGSL